MDLETVFGLAIGVGDTEGPCLTAVFELAPVAPMGWVWDEPA